MRNRNIRLGSLRGYVAPGDIRIGRLRIGYGYGRDIDSGVRFFTVRLLADLPRCSAHGDAFCGLCSLNGPSCDQCLAYQYSGMHWDTCPNRARSACERAR